MSDGPQLAADLASELSGLRKSVEDAEQAYKSSNLQRGTRDDVAELALVRAMGLFEEFLGDLFFLGMLGKLGAEVVPIVSAQNEEEATLLIAGSDAGDARYIAWMPLKEKTLKRGDRLFTNGQPFSRLANRSSEKSAISDLTVVRNRIAHDSPIARSKFVDLAKSKGYPHTRAADYLMSKRGTDSEILLGLVRLQSIGEGLAEPTEIGARAYLVAEDPYEPSVLAPPGNYQCARGGHPQSTTVYTTLGDCPACPRPVRCTECGRADKLKTLWARL